MNLSRRSVHIASRIGLVAAVAGIFGAMSPMTFAQGNIPISYSHHSGDGNQSHHNKSESGGSKFQLTSLTVSSAQGSRQTFKLTVTVTQTGADGSSDTKNFHSFPSKIYIQLLKGNDNVINSTPYPATLATGGNPGITFEPGQHKSVSGTVNYSFTLPSGVSISRNENLRIFSPPAKNAHSSSAPYTFRMGTPSDPSWSDDVVGGTGTDVENLPYGQLPEVPYAAALPLAGALTAMAMWRFRQKLQRKAEGSIQ